MEKMNIIEVDFIGECFSTKENGDVFDISEWAIRNYDGRGFAANAFAASTENCDSNIAYYKSELEDSETEDTSEMGDFQWSHFCDRTNQIKECIALYENAKKIKDWDAVLCDPVATGCKFNGYTPLNRAARRFAEQHNFL